MVQWWAVISAPLHNLTARGIYEQTPEKNADIKPTAWLISAAHTKSVNIKILASSFEYFKVLFGGQRGTNILHGLAKWHTVEQDMHETAYASHAFVIVAWDTLGMY